MNKTKFYIVAFLRGGLKVAVPVSESLAVKTLAKVTNSLYPYPVAIVMGEEHNCSVSETPEDVFAHLLNRTISKLGLMPSK